MKKLYILTALFAFLFPLTAQGTVAGKVDYHSGEAWALRDGERIALQKGVEIHSGDMIVTAMSGRAKLSMVDDSVVYVGRQSRITIDKYEMKKGSLFSGSFNMLWGKVRFLVAKLNTGGSSFSVHTKTATIGVRGTQFAVLVNPPSVVPKPFVKVPDNVIPNAATTVMLFEGAVIGKSVKGQIVSIAPGTIVRLKPNGAVLSRKIQKHDMKVLDIEPLALEKGSQQPGKRVLRSPTKLEPAKSPASLKRGSALTSPAKPKPTTTPTKLEPLTSTMPGKLERGGTLTSPTKAAPLPTRAAPLPTKAAPLPTRAAPLPTKIAPLPTKIAPLPTKIAPLPTKIAPPPTKIAPPPTKIAPPPTKIAPPPPPPPRVKVYVPPPPTVNRGSLPTGTFSKTIGTIGTIKPR